MKGSIASSEIIDRLCTLTNICRNDFQMFAEYICEVVCNTMSLK